ncbi:Prolyl tripeptidyl peptidase precursor [compost metagenome]
MSDFSGAKGAFRLMADGRLVFQADLGGRQINDLYVVDLTKGAQPENLTATDDVNETYPLPSSDGFQLAYAARQANRSSDNIMLRDLRTGDIRQLTDEQQTGLQWLPAAFSRDGEVLIVNRYDFSFAFGEVFAVEAATGRMTQLTPTGRYGHGSDISGDGRYVALAVETEGGVRQAAILDRNTGEQRLLDPGAWEQRTIAFSPDGKSLLYVTNLDGQEVVSLYDVASDAHRRLPLPEGVNSQAGYISTSPSFSPDGRYVLFPHSSGSTPQDYWTFDLTTGLAARMTRLNNLEAQTLPRTSIVHYPSADGTLISAVLWTPYNLERDGRAPAVIISHGGPTGQQMDSFERLAAALASRGYMVLSPNFRGSTGYGQAFTKANYLDLGGGDLEDVVAGVAFLKQTGYVDPRKVGIAGGSYGGYMTLIALAKKPEVFAAGVDMFGIVNWRTMWERGAPQNRRYQEGLVGIPDDHPEVYDSASPLTRLDQVRAPLLVLHGENDPLVPAHESRQVVDFLEARGRVVEAHFYEGEGHGFAQPANQIDSLQRTIAWFEAHLK